MLNQRWIIQAGKFVGKSKGGKKETYMPSPEKDRNFLLGLVLINCPLLVGKIILGYACVIRACIINIVINIVDYLFALHRPCIFRKH